MKTSGCIIVLVWQCIGGYRDLSLVQIHFYCQTIFNHNDELSAWFGKENILYALKKIENICNVPSSDTRKFALNMV